LTETTEQTCWAVYRHRERPEIRYYVQEKRNAYPAFVASNGAYGAPDASCWRLAYETDEEGGCCVRLKACRNVLHDDSDYLPHQAPEGGLWPLERFLELYERSWEEG
jgi:hypothetical protein